MLLATLLRLGPEGARAAGMYRATLEALQAQGSYTVAPKAAKLLDLLRPSTPEYF